MIKKNLDQNNVTNYSILENIIGDENCEIQWQRNKNFSVDSRVTGLEKDFVYEKGIQKTLGNIISSYADTDSIIFIKIDTQGYEERVINGGLSFLLKNTNYLIKMEFAPFWLESQKTNPEKFIRFMVDNFDVIELSRSTFKSDSITKMFEKKIFDNEIVEFTEYVKGLGKDNKGWVELLVKNKDLVIR